MTYDWRNDPATEVEKAKLSFFGCTWDDGITRGQASDAIKQCVAMFPGSDLDYQRRPPGEEHLAVLRSLGVIPEETGTVPTIAHAERLISDLQTKGFTAEFMPIKRRIEHSLVVTDDDFQAIEFLKKKYDIELTLEGNFAVFRSAYLIEAKHQLPQPISVDLMLGEGETAYYSIRSSWHQVANPNQVTGTKQLANGFLYVTSKRLLFSGVSRSIATSLEKIVNCHCYTDFLKVDKTTGKSDLFSMTVAEARYIMALVRALKNPQAAKKVAVKSKGEGDAYLARVRDQAATAKQKAKLCYFDYDFDEGITKGQAHDAIDECVKRFPEKEKAYYNRLATAEQIKILHAHLKRNDEELEDYADVIREMRLDNMEAPKIAENLDDTAVVASLTYREAKDLIQDFERADQREEIESYGSEESQKDEAFFRLDSVFGGKRELTREEFDKVWDLAKSRAADKSVEPCPTELMRAVVELFPEFI